MADLRLVGVHDDGEHLLLSGSEGEIYLLPLDEALRTAVGKNNHRFARSSQPSGTKMSPREIQSLIRAGASAGDVAEQAALTIEQVRRYEGPVLAEREYIATQARGVQVAAAGTSNDGYRSAFGEVAASLDDMVKHRLKVFGIDPKSLQWDAWRDQAGAWTVSADFEPGTQWAATSIGEPTPALWRFHPARKSLHNANRWAQQLSELEPLDSPVPERRLSAVADKPFDVEAHSTTAASEPGGDLGPDAAEAADGESAGSAHGLLDLLRSRRGVRLGANEADDDELAAMLGTHVPSTQPQEGSFYSAPEPPAQTPVVPPLEVAASARERLRSIPFLKLAPTLGSQGENPLDGSNSTSEVSTETRELVLSGEPAAANKVPPAATQHAADKQRDTGAGPDVGGPEASGPSDSEVAARLERKAAAKPKRSSVPSWDEIVFGTKGD